MEPNEIITNIGTFVLPLVTAAAGWLAGRRKQKNDFLHDLQSSINLLSSENKRLLEEITSANNEIIALRKENEELKASVDHTDGPELGNPVKDNLLTHLDAHYHRLTAEDVLLEVLHRFVASVRH